MRHYARVVVVLVGILALFGSACEKKGGQTGPTPIITGPLAVQAITVGGSATLVSGEGDAETFVYDLPYGGGTNMEVRLNTPGKPVHVVMETDPYSAGWPNFDDVRSNSVDPVLLYKFFNLQAPPPNTGTGVTRIVVTVVATADSESAVRRTYIFRLV